MPNYEPDKAHPLHAAEKGSFTDTGKYPYLHVSQRPCGCLYIDDMTPGYEQHHRFRCSGGIESTGPNGEKVHVFTGKKHEYVADGLSLVVDGQHDVKVSGNQRIAVSGSHHLETSGNHYIGANGSIVMSSNGSHVNSTTGGDIHNIANGHMISQVDGDVSEIVGGNTVHQIAGTLVFKANQDIVLNSLKSLTLQCGESSLTLTPTNAYLVSPGININSADDNFVFLDKTSVNVRAASSMNLVSGSSTTLKSPILGISGNDFQDTYSSTYIQELTVGAYGVGSAPINIDGGEF